MLFSNTKAAKLLRTMHQQPRSTTISKHMLVYMQFSTRQHTSVGVSMCQMIRTVQWGTTVTKPRSRDIAEVPTS